MQPIRERCVWMVLVWPIHSFRLRRKLSVNLFRIHLVNQSVRVTFFSWYAHNSVALTISTRKNFNAVHFAKSLFRLCCSLKFETQKAHSTDCGISWNFVALILHLAHERLMNLNKIHRHQHTTHNKTEWETAHKHIHIININSEAFGSSFFTPFFLSVSLVLSLWILCWFIEMLKWLRDAQWPTNVMALTLRFLYWNHTLLKAAEVYFHSEIFFLMCCCCTSFLSRAIWPFWCYRYCWCYSRCCCCQKSLPKIVVVPFRPELKMPYKRMLKTLNNKWNGNRLTQANSSFVWPNTQSL